MNERTQEVKKGKRETEVGGDEKGGKDRG